MAGEIEEPFRFDFQADLLHSGSISFGRFESESLSWERRSSFSHNRYLEEVEKYSKPGSVTEKKAYFEAHFRRKALLKQSSSESQDGRESKTSENDDSLDLEESDNGNESKHFTCFDESPRSFGHSEYDEETEVRKYEKDNVEILYAENGSESSHATSFHESSHSSKYDEEGKVQRSEREEVGVSSVASKHESISTTVDHLVSDAEHLKLKETHQSGTENVVVIRSEENSRENLSDMVVMVDVASEANDSSLPSHARDRDDDSAKSGPQQMFSPMVRPTSEMKQTKKANANGSTKAKTRENKGLLTRGREKISPRPPSTIARSGRKTSNSEESSTIFSKAKILPPKKSIVKEYKSEKTVEAKPSLSEKSLPGARQMANRTKQSISTNKPHIKQSAAGFSFKTNQRAEKRKEEKKAAEMTQVQKNLNFKATPMPSFYTESARSSDQNKVISTSKTPTKPQTPPLATRTNRFPSTPSDRRPSSSPSSTNRTRPSEPPRKNLLPEKRVPEKKAKQKGPEPTRGPQARAVVRKTGI